MSLHDLRTQDPKTALPRVYDLGIDMKDAKRLDLSEECFRYARTIARAVEDRALEAAASNHLGILALEDGRLGIAAERFEAARRIREASGPRPTDDAWVYLAGTLVNLGNTKLAAWEASRAAELYDAAIARLSEARDAGSRTAALAPFLANAQRGASAA